MTGPSNAAARLLCRKRVDIDELIDSESITPEQVRATVRDQEIVNRWLGGGHATWAHALPALRKCKSDSVRLLDIACGGADLSRRMIDEARRLGKHIEAVGVDFNRKTIAYARQSSAGYPELSFVCADALRLPFRTGEFDIVIMATFLHHLPPDLVVKALRSAGRVCKGQVIAADLVRSPLARLGIVIFGPLAGFNPVSRHDGAISVCRAYTPDELAGLARQAGLRRWRLHQHRFYRMALVYPATGRMEGTN